MEINQYGFVIVNLDPTIGSEIKKTRPCVVVSPNEMNRYLRTIVIAPITSNPKSYPTRVKVKFEGKDGRIVVDQLRTIDKSRIVKVKGKLSASHIKRLKNIIYETYVA